MMAEGEGGGLDGILDKAIDVQAQFDAQDLQAKLNDARMIALKGIFDKQLAGNSDWQAASSGGDWGKMVDMIRENDYRVAPQYAKEFAFQVAYELVYSADKDLAKSYKGAMETAFNEGANQEERQKAFKKLNMLNSISDAQFGFNVDQVRRQGELIGFDDRMWQQNIQQVASRKIQLEQSAWEDVMTEGQIKSYVSAIKDDVKGFQYNEAEAQGIDELKRLAIAYRQSLRDGDPMRRGFQQAAGRYIKPKYG